MNNFYLTELSKKVINSTFLSPTVQSTPLHRVQLSVQTTHIMNERSDLALQPPGTGYLPFKIDYTLFYFLMSQVYFSELKHFADKTNIHFIAILTTAMFTIWGKGKIQDKSNQCTTFSLN